MKPLSQHESAEFGPLSGVVVVAIEQALAAPLCTCRLADMGARVIKIERGEGDFARGYDAAANGQSSYFVWTNRGKESLVLDFKQPADAQLLTSIIGNADVFVQNLAPGALARAGFDSASLRAKNSRLITCDITGYGEDGPASKLKAYDMLVQCESGLAGISGTPEGYGRIGVSICDIGAGLNAVIGVLSALAMRERTGLGCGISISLFDATADWMTIPYLHEVYGDGAPKRVGMRHPSIAPYGAFATRDGHDVVIGIQNEREWQSFCDTFLLNPEIAGDPRFASNKDRVKNRTVLEPVISAVFGQLSAEEALDRLEMANTAYGQVRSVADMAAHPALRKRRMQVDGTDLEMIAAPVRAPWDATRFREAPRLGEHSERLRREFTTTRSQD